MSNDLSSYRTILDRAYLSVGQAVGVHVLLLVFERALWMTKHTYEEASLIRFSEDGLSFDGLNAVPPERATLVAQEFVESVIATLSRLVGQPMALQLTRQLPETEEAPH
ncbi:MAG TPA: hypothetical protein VGL40_13105 [Bacillota bacterium]